MDLPKCRHRAAEISPGRWECKSPKMVIPGRAVTADICRTECPYVDHPLSSATGQDSATNEVDTEFAVEDFRRKLAHDTSTLPKGWQNWQVAQLAHAELFNDAAAAEPDYPIGRFSGRGIVIAAGGPVYFGCAFVCASVLRELGCELPIEFWHLGPDEIDAEMSQLVEPLGVTCIDALSFTPQPRRLNGWELKPFSVLNSGFREVLYLDADNVPAKDPSYLFDTDEYQTDGAVFWPDLPDEATPHAYVRLIAWDVAQINWRSGPAFESGQYMIDKSRCWRELNLCMHLNEHSDFWYHYVYGDKDTFKLAWHKLERHYSMPKKRSTWQWPAIHQYDFDDSLLFTHACQGKQQLVRSDTTAGVAQNDLAVKASQKLRTLWSHEKSFAGWNPFSPAIQELARSGDCLRLERQEPQTDHTDNIRRCKLYGECVTAEEHQVSPRVQVCAGCNDLILAPAAKPVRTTRVEGLSSNGVQLSGSLVQDQGRLLMAYCVGLPASEIRLCELDAQFKPVWDRPIDVPRSVENRVACRHPRAFVFHDQLHLAYVGIQAKTGKLVANDFYCRLDSEYAVRENYFLGSTEAETGTISQFFESAGQLYAVSRIAPHVVTQINAIDPVVKHRRDWHVLWKAGEMTAGATPVYHNMEYYSFFLGVSYSTNPPRQSIGCYTFEAKPPFRPQRVVHEPLMPPLQPSSGAENSPISVHPCGAIFQGERWLVSYGSGNNEISIAEFHPDEIESSLAKIPATPN